MTIAWDQIKHCFEVTEPSWRITDSLSQTLDTTAQQGDALWEALRQNAYVPVGWSHWNLMSEATENSFTIKDFWELILQIQEEESITSNASYYVEDLQGWSSAFDVMLTRLGDTAKPLRKGWSKLKEPLRAAMGWALVRHGLMPVEDLTNDVLPQIADRLVINFTHSSYSKPLYQGAENIWPRQQWGRAILDAALSPDHYEVNLHILERWLDLATPDESLVLCLRGARMDPKRSVQILESRGESVLPTLMEEGRKLTKDPEITSPYYSESASCAMLSLALFELGSGMPPELDLVYRAASMHNTHADQLPTMLAMYRSIPQERRQKILQPCLDNLFSVSSEYSLGLSLNHATALQTPAAGRAVVRAVTKMPRTMQESAGNACRQLLANIGESARDALLIPATCPQRSLLVEALGALDGEEVTQLLIAYVGDKQQETSEVAMDALINRPWDSLENPLEKALAARKKATRMGAAIILRQRTITEQSHALAQARLKKEKVAEIITLLEDILAAAPGENATPDAPAHITAMDALDPNFVQHNQEALQTFLGDWNETPEPLADFLSRLEPTAEALLSLRDALITACDDAYVNIAAIALPLLSADPLAWTPWLMADFLYGAHQALGAALVTEVMKQAHAHWGAELLTAMRHGFEAHGLVKNQGFLEVMLCHDAAFTRDILTKGYLSTEKSEVAVADQYISEQNQSDMAPSFWPWLTSPQTKTRTHAAQWLEANPLEASQAALHTALGREKSKKVKPALLLALEACQVLEDSIMDDFEALNAALAQRPGAGLLMPSFVDQDGLPELQWDDQTSVSTKALGWILAVTAQESDDRHSQALRKVQNRLDASTAEALVQALETQYEASKQDNEAKHAWLMFQGTLGDDARMEDLGEPLDEMARNKASAWAFRRVEALRRQAGPVAIYWLDVWANTARSKGLQGRAGAALEAMANEEDLMLGDLLQRATPPRHGFSNKKQRQLTVGQQTLILRLTPLQLVIQTQQGKELYGSALNSELGHTLARPIIALRESVNRSLRLSVATMERAMNDARLWSNAQWEALFADHPLMAACVPGVVFSAQTKDTETLFTVLQGNRLQQLEGAAFTLSEDTTVHIPHPVNLDEDTRQSWRTMLESNKLDQPFEQLARDIYTWSSKESTPFKSMMERQVSLKHKPRLLLDRAQSMGYLRGPVEDGGIFYAFTRALGAAHRVELHHEGFSVADLRYGPKAVKLVGFGVYGTDHTALEPSSLPSLAFSEAMRDLTQWLQ